MNVLKLLINITLIYVAISLFAGIEVAFIVLLTFAGLVFFPLVIEPVARLTNMVKWEKEPGFFEDDYWTPGQPAITQKAFVQGFFK